jgi:signal-transduction protein with cAMP-binding, CBS, and nucleotidyltransferase domain
LALGSPPARFAWLSGSQGRKEQLLLTDQTAFGFEVQQNSIEKGLFS